MRPAPVNSRRGAEGFSLVEILISIAIGLFILAGVTSLYINNRESYRLQSALARVQENARFAIQIVEREIRKAGYRSDITQSHASVFPASSLGASDGLSFPTGRVVRGKQDELLLRYQGSGTPADGTVTDCAGRPVAANEVAVVVLRRVGTELVCDRATTTGTLSQPLVGGIEALEFEFGWDLDDDGNADKYQPQGNSSQTTVSIRTTFTVVADELNVVRSGDRRLRRSYTQLTALRNSTPDRGRVRNPRSER